MKKWIINCTIFENEEQNNKALIVLQDIVDEFNRLIPSGPPLGYKPLQIINDSVSGPTLFFG